MRAKDELSLLDAEAKERKQREEAANKRQMTDLAGAEPPHE